VRNLLTCLGLLGLIPAASAFSYAPPLPENTLAFSNCNAKVKVSSARLRVGPSLEAPVLGVRKQDQSLFVTKVCGKWVQVATESGDTAYVAAYLLSFPYAELLEQWKKDTRPPTVGKKARVKWASVNFRRYPAAASDRMGRFVHGEEVAVLSNLGSWSLIEARARDGSACYGFVSNRALGAPEIPDPAEWTAPLARVHAVPGKAPPAMETPSQYLARTAWSPQVFAAEWKSAHRAHALPQGDYLASIN
jgi:hypothetical protein